MLKHRLNRRNALTLLAGAAALALPGCGVAGESLRTYRYRLTVEVETPEGLRTGSSVIEVRSGVAGRNSIPTPGAFWHHARGEAVAVDLGKRGTLFGLLRSDMQSDWASSVMFGLAPELPPIYNSDGKFDNSALVKARFMAMLKMRDPIVLPERFRGSRYIKGDLASPILVRFGDMADPWTIQKLSPDDLAAEFGSGVKLRRITVQITDDPVTAGIEKLLPWLPRINQRLKGTGFQAKGVPVGDFGHLFSTENFDQE